MLAYPLLQDFADELCSHHLDAAAECLAERMALGKASMSRTSASISLAVSKMLSAGAQHSVKAWDSALLSYMT